jgi:hypothetical protein
MFNGYLKQYVRRLSGQDTTSLYKLADYAKDSHRLRAPLFLYAMCNGKVDLLLKATKDKELNRYYGQLAGKYTFDGLMVALDNKDASLDENFHKTYNSFVQKRDMPQTHKRAKLSMHDKIRRLQNEKGVTNYRLYTDLNLNPSNVNNFLKNKDVANISRGTARQMMLYLEAYA